MHRPRRPSRRLRRNSRPRSPATGNAGTTADRKRAAPRATQPPHPGPGGRSGRLVHLRLPLPHLLGILQRPFRASGDGPADNAGLAAGARDYAERGLPLMSAVSAMAQAALGSGLLAEVQLIAAAFAAAAILI